MKNAITLTLFLLILSIISVSAQEESFEDIRKRAERLRAESQYDSALVLFQNLALMGQKEQDAKKQAIAAIGLGGLYIDIDKADLAIESYREAMYYADLADTVSLVNRGYYGIGVGYHLKWYLGKSEVNYDSAVYYYTQAESMFMAQGEEVQASDLAYNISLLHYDKKNYVESLKKVNEALKVQVDLNNLRSIGRSLRHIGYVYYQINNYDSADYYLRRALKITDENNFLDDGLLVLQQLAELYEARNDYRTSNDFLKEYYKKSSSIYSQEYDQRILELRTQYETASAELDAEQAKSRSLRLEKNRNITIIVAASLLILFSIWLYVIDQKRKNIKAIAAKNDQLNKQRIDELLQQQEIASLQGVLEGQEQERKRVAIDLHDRLGGILSMVKLHFSAVEEKLPEDNPEKKKFLTASELLDLAAGEVRSISHNLLSGVLAKFGLLPALKDLTDRINESGEIKLNLIYYNIENALNGEQELQIYRIVQELISNILKHSEADEATIQLIRNDDEKKVNLIVEDDGKGFNPNAPSLSGGIGLSNLKARVGKLNGSFHIDSGKGVGTSISIDIPIEDD